MAMNNIERPSEIEIREKQEEKTETTVEEKAEEWTWVKGYKGTDKDMKCRDYQYKLMECFDISGDTPVKECEHGFHLCRCLDDVFNYYPIGNENRFFEVKALVRKTDWDNSAGKVYCVCNTNGGITFRCGTDKYVAKSIIFTRELTVDEILAGRITGDWTEEEKKRAIEIGIEGAMEEAQFKHLVEVGYSETFAKAIVEAGKGEIAYSVGTQEGLSMDMKVWTIFNS